MCADRTGTDYRRLPAPEAYRLGYDSGYLDAEKVWMERCGDVAALPHDATEPAPDVNARSVRVRSRDELKTALADDTADIVIVENGTYPDATEPAGPHDDEYDALARQFHESIAEGLTIAETAKALRLLSPGAPREDERLREALEIIAAPPTDAPDAIGVKARNIARAALDPKPHRPQEDSVYVPPGGTGQPWLGHDDDPEPSR